MVTHTVRGPPKVVSGRIPCEVLSLSGIGIRPWWADENATSAVVTVGGNAHSVRGPPKSSNGRIPFEVLPLGGIGIRPWWADKVSSSALWTGSEKRTGKAIDECGTGLDPGQRDDRSQREKGLDIGTGWIRDGPW